jgi:thiamine pyrophosphokinase
VESHTNSVIVLSGGEPLVADGDFELPDDAYVIAADSGLHHAAILGLNVDLVVGDMDSVEPAALDAAIEGGSATQRHPTDKDHTDLELAIETAVARRPNRILVVGSYAGRLDHLLGAMQLLAATAGRVDEITWTDGQTDVAVCRSGRAVTIRGRAGDRVSLLPGVLDATGISVKGLRWTLDGETLSAGSSRGLSNVLTSDRAVISVAAGLILIIHERTDR